MRAKSQGLTLVYLGKRGGGLNLYLDLVTSLEAQGSPNKSFLSASIRREVRNLGLEGEINFLYSPASILEILNLRSFFVGIRGFITFLKLRKNERLVFLMPSPFDLALYRIAKFMKNEIFCCVHDLKAHPGESWPSKSAVRSRIKLASALVAFSLPIASLLRTLSNKPIYVVPLPDTIPLIGNISSSAKSFLESMISSTKVKVLMIGRIHEYKNAPLILQVSSILNEFLFCIAGDLSIEIEETENILILNKWLTNLEFDSSLQAADIIVFPYSEASQSGSIPLAIAKNKWIVAADHPGFRDQLKLYDKKVLFQSNSSSEFSKALIQAKTLSQIEISRKEPSDKPEMRNRDLVGLLLQRMESN